MGGVAGGALTGCGPGKMSVSSQNVYTNNYYVTGVGYYHAPFRGWYALPYNHFDPQTQRYFYGGQWGTMPFESITNLSSPTPEVAAAAQAQRTDISHSNVPRSGFGSSSRGGSHVWS